MTFQSEIENITERAAKQLASGIDERLRSYRSLCQSDKEFANRTSEITFQNIPLMKQYTFDGKPIFYSLITFPANHIKIEIKDGEYKP
jgi:CRISPR/Cas system-associated exonuclease Cas4 (RecB family)